MLEDIIIFKYLMTKSVRETCENFPGSIVRDSQYFHNKRCIWPEGYTALRKFFSIRGNSLSIYGLFYTMLLKAINWSYSFIYTVLCILFSLLLFATCGIFSHIFFSQIQI